MARHRGSGVAAAIAASLAAQQQAVPTAGVQGALPPAIPGQGGQPGMIRWGGQYFHSPEELVAWMQARGVHTTVAQFLARHAGAAAIYQQRAVHGTGGGVGNYAGMAGGGGYGAQYVG